MQSVPQKTSNELRAFIALRTVAGDVGAIENLFAQGGQQVPRLTDGECMAVANSCGSIGILVTYIAVRAVFPVRTTIN